jgi:Protein of unknown function (DUF3300)
MKTDLTGTIAAGVIVLLLSTASAPAQAPPADPAAVQSNPGQLDQLLAPVALYPDPLLAQILMAATYPLEVVQADRWIGDPGNAALQGDQLATAADTQPWDPSVKSLVPFPQILHMMDNNLDWTERLGEAFIANQAAVMDAVQQLRQQAAAAGTLHSTPQDVVTNEGQDIAIEPPNPETVYVPVYDPSVAFGAWPYPDYPPDYFPGYFDGAIYDGFGFGWFGLPIFGPFWGWNHWRWHDHRIDIDRGRFTALNGNHPPAGGGTWQHDPAHRSGVPYHDAGLRERFPRAGAAMPTARSLSGAAAPAQQFHDLPRIEHPAAPAFAPPVQRAPPVFESYGRGADVRAQAERGRASQMSAPAFHAQSAPSFGGRGHR